MSKVTLESLAKRVTALEEHLKIKQPIKDWRLAAGMFTDNKISRQIDVETRKIREADRRAARRDY